MFLHSSVNLGSMCKGGERSVKVGGGSDVIIRQLHHVSGTGVRKYNMLILQLRYLQVLAHLSVNKNRRLHGQPSLTNDSIWVKLLLRMWS